MTTLHVEECPLCRHTQFQLEKNCEDFFVSHEMFSLYKCTHCNFVFTQDAPATNEMARYYETTDYISHSDTQKGFVNLIYHYVRKLMIRKKVRLATNKKSIGNLLDVGCGTGYFLGSVKQKGWNVTGIEQSEKAAKIAQNKFDVNVLQPEALNGLSENQFDIITLWHVLEHLENLNESMNLFSKLLKKEGKLIIAVPNNHSYDAAKYQSYWAAYDVPRHLWHFSPDTLTFLAQKHQFKIVPIKSMPFDAFYISMLSEKYKKHTFATIRGIFTGCIAYVATLFNKKKSSSLIYLLQK